MDNILNGIYKRALVLFALLVLIVVIFINPRWLVLAGFIIGGGVSALKYKLTTGFLKGLLMGSSSEMSGRFAGIKSVTLFIGIYGGLVLMFLITAEISIYMLAGFFTGILLMPAVVFINSILQLILKGRRINE